MKDILSTCTISLVMALLELASVAFWLFMLIGLVLSGTPWIAYFNQIYISALALVFIIFSVCTYFAIKYIKS